MGIKYHTDLIQGSDEWLDARCGLLTASEMKLIITPSLKIAANEKERTHLFELLAQRITRYVEPKFISDEMIRGKVDEIQAKELYAEKFALVEEVGFIANDRFGFTLGYSPDGLIGSDGCIEVKSRSQKYQVQTILANECPEEFILQIQTGLMVSERKWCDFISYCAGMPMLKIRVYASNVIQDAIFHAAYKFEKRLVEAFEIYNEKIRTNLDLVPTERSVEREMHL